MKRDLELARRILLDVEGQEDNPGASGWEALVEEGFTMEAIHYHIQILDDAGLIRADELVPGQWWPERMTWKGHEFLDAARNDSLWEEAKRRVQERVGAAPFGVVHELLVEMVQEAVRTPRPRSRRK